MKKKISNPFKPVFGVRYENAGQFEEYKFEHTLIDLENKVTKNIFTKNEIDLLFQSIKKSEGREFANPTRAQEYVDLFELPKEVILKVEAVAKEATGENWLIADFALCTYTNKIGQPNLKMHRDENFKSQRICFDYQLESNTSWDIVVGKDIYHLEDNSGILFSSTDQYHGRPFKAFKDDEYIKLIFFHMSKDGVKDSKD
jgi:hypothetical protein